LPSCSTCTKSKIDCQYGGNKKRGRKSKHEKLVIQQEVTDLANELNFTKSLAQAWSKVIAEYKNPIAPTKFDEGTEIFLKLPSSWNTILQTYEENYKTILPGFDHFASNKEIANLIWNTSLSTPSEFQLLWQNLEVQQLATFVEYLASFLIGAMILGFDDLASHLVRQVNNILYTALVLKSPSDIPTMQHLMKGIALYGCYFRAPKLAPMLRVLARMAYELFTKMNMPNNDMEAVLCCKLAMSSDHVAHERWMNRIKTLEAQGLHAFTKHIVYSALGMNLLKLPAATLALSDAQRLFDAAETSLAQTPQQTVFASVLMKAMKAELYVRLGDQELCHRTLGSIASDLNVASYNLRVVISQTLQYYAVVSLDNQLVLGPWLYDFILSGVQQTNALRFISDSSDYNSSEHNDSDEIDGTFSWSSNEVKETESFAWSDPQQLTFNDTQLTYDMPEKTNLDGMW
jgi:hypothetical protein